MSINLICENCVREFSVPPSHMKRLRYRFCSMACRSAYAKRPDVISQRFWQHVDKRGSNECWKWNGTIDHSGYGVLAVRGKRLAAHRLSWIFAHGEIPSGMVICHRCDTPPCVNPSHLFLGTLSDNTQDMIRKGRNFNGTTKLTPEQVVEIRSPQSITRRLADVASDYGVHYMTIFNIRHRISWKAI